MKYLLIILIGSLTAFSGCIKETEWNVPSVEGIEFSPRNNYQEAYPGSIVSFNVKANVPGTVTKFGVKFKMPGSTEFVALPQYPDFVPDGQFASGFGLFEYALPPSTVDANTEIKFKFSAATESKVYEAEYTVKILSKGNQLARIYSPLGASPFKFTALDLASGSGVPANSPAAAQDMSGITRRTTYPPTGQTFDGLAGFVSNNGTRFKVVTAANYNSAATQYASIYNASTSLESSGFVSLGLVSLYPGTSELLAGAFYIAKVVRTSGVSYVGISVKKLPAIRLLGDGATLSLDLTTDLLEFEIKK